jgi:hypothetical protein
MSGFKARIDDLVISCHGGVPDRRRVQFKVPPDVEILIPTPQGARLYKATARMMEHGDRIEGLVLISGSDQFETMPEDRQPIEPKIYREGDLLPPIFLAPQTEDFYMSVDGPDVVGPKRSGNLADLWDEMVDRYLQRARRRGRTLKVFLAICLTHVELDRKTPKKRPDEFDDQPPRVQATNKKDPRPKKGVQM